MENEDLVDVAARQFLEGHNFDSNEEVEKTPPVEAAAETGANTVLNTDDINTDTTVKKDVLSTETETVADIPQEKLLAKFNELSGLNLDSVDKLKDLAEKYNKVPEYEQQLEVLPELLDIMGKFENPLNYFKDEIAFKVNELSKDKKYDGKENLIDKVLRSNLNEVKDVDVIAIASQLKAKDGVRNPLRAELKSMGLDPDEVLESYDSLDDDTKDLLKIKADQFREELPEIGKDIKVPTIEGTTLERILNEKKASKEDLQARKEKLMPLSQSIVSQVKELKLSNDFSFKLELTPEQVGEYAEELTDIVASGQYDMNTEEGKQAVYGELISMFKNDFFDKIFESYDTSKTSQLEENARRKFNNEKPLDKKEPAPTEDETEKHPMQKAAEEMVSRGW